MIIQSSATRRSRPSAAAAQGDWQLATGHYEAAQIPLEIINPQEGLTTGTSARSYYYRCYPDPTGSLGLPWRVPISVLGGAWPFHYEILTGPSGMTIGQDYGDTDYGILSWSTPTAGSHSISVKVTDQEGTSDTHSWTLTVTTANALFVNQATGTNIWNNPGAATGAIDDPFKNVHDWWLNGFNDNTYSGHHVYYYSGTYRTSWDWDTVNGGLDGQVRMRDKPCAHIGVSGQSVVFDTESFDTEFKGGAFFIADGAGLDDYFFGNVSIQGIGHATNTYRNKFVQLAAGDRFVFFECQMGNQAAPGGTSTNAAYLTCGRLSPSYRQFISFHNNVISGLNSIQFAEFYSVDKMVADGNTIQNQGGSTQRLIYAKEDTKNITIRNTTNVTDTNCVLLHVGSSVGVYDEFECCWNNSKLTGATTAHVQFGIESTVNMGQNYVYRNNFTNGTIIMQQTSGGGPVNLFKNVRQYDSGTNGITDNSAAFTYNNNDTVVATSGLVDASTNLLTGANRTTYLGLQGCEVD